MSETEHISLEGYQTERALLNLPNALNAVIRRGQGRILVACNAGRIRSEVLKSMVPEELLANPDMIVGYNDLSLYETDGPLVVPAPNEHALILKRHPVFIPPFNRILLANGNYKERETADVLVIRPLLNRYQSRLSQIITVDLRG